jgi:hypothetical protein
VYAESNLTFDGNKLELGVQAAATGTVINIIGSQGTLLEVTDTATGDLLQVGDISGTPIFAVNSDGYTKTTSGYYTGKTADYVVFSVADTSGVAAVFDYYVINTTTNGYRTGIVMVVWNATANTATFTDMSSEDLGSSTAGLIFSAAIISNNIELKAEITTGTWTIKIGARVL